MYNNSNTDKFSGTHAQALNSKNIIYTEKFLVKSKTNSWAKLTYQSKFHIKQGKLHWWKQAS